MMKRLILGFVFTVSVACVSAAWADFFAPGYHPVSWSEDGSNPIYVEIAAPPGDPCKEVMPASATVVVLDGGVHYCS